MPAGVRRWYRARLVDKIGNTGDWTDFKAGMSNVNADDLIGSVVEEYLQSDDGKALLTPLITDPNALAESILANYDDVEQQWANYGDNKAGVIQAKKVAADAQSSVAELNTTVTAKFAEQQAAIEEKLTAYADANGGSAIYTLKAGVQYGGTQYDAGLSVAVTINGSSVDTRFAVNANQFVVINGSGKNVYSPFVIKDGQVLISQAFIGEGWITNAMIGGYIQSNDFVSGSKGWRLDKSGTFERNAANGSGRVIDTGVLKLTYDANGTLRIREGLW